MTNEPRALATPVEDAPPMASAATAAPRPTAALYWSVRREVWEHRSIWMAPLITAGVLLFMFVLIMVVMTVPGRVAAMPYEIAPSFMLVVMALIWVYYSLDALYGERRDRSILFWKSLPVSDLTTVLSKAAILLLVLPAVTFVVSAALQLALWLAHKALGPMAGVPIDAPGPFPLLWSWTVVLYGLAVMTLWLAPVLAWCLLVSAWAPRAPLVWAALPPMALGKLEEVVFGTRHIATRWVSWSPVAFTQAPSQGLVIDPMASPTPSTFLSTPGLWIGLTLAAVFLAVAVPLRRRRSAL